MLLVTPEQSLQLETWYLQFHTDTFIANDPICIPHLFSHKQDIEIAGFLTATIAWGQRKVILRNARKLMQRMDNSPHQFLLFASPAERNQLKTFTHRTFQGDDCVYFLQKLTELYQTYRDMESFLQTVIHPGDIDISNGLIGLRQFFFPNRITHRASKHFADIHKNAAAKRLCMFFRWMVRQDSAGIDFGIWTSLSAKQLICPLDVHSGRVARLIGILQRKTNDWQAAQELTACLRQIDPDDPVRFDFALFGAGVTLSKNEK